MPNMPKRGSGDTQKEQNQEGVRRSVCRIPFFLRNADSAQRGKPSGKKHTTMTKPGKAYLSFLIVFLGLLSAFGPFIIDMYLPVAPEMAAAFRCDASAIQLGLTFCMVGLAALAGGGLPAYISSTVCMLFAIGLVLTGSTTMAMEAGRDAAGVASAVVGGIGYTAGGLTSPLVGLGDIQVTSFSLCGILLLLGTLMGRRAAPERRH